MAKDKERKLLSEFPPVTTQQWEEIIEKDLKGADYQKKLVWRTAEGFDVRPYYRAEDLEKIEYLGAGIAEFPYVRSTGKSNDWLVQQTITAYDVVKANEQARRVLMSGTEAIAFRVNGKKIDAASIDTLLEGIHLEAIEVTFTGSSVGNVADLILAKAEREGWDKQNVRINFVIDPIILKLSLKGGFECSEDGDKCFERIKGLVEKGAEYKKFRFVGVSGQQFHNSGSTIVQELAFTLAAGHEYLVRLMQAGLSIEAAAKTIRFSMAVSANYFMEMAKFRAARMLWATIVRAYEPKCPCAEKMFTHAVTSKWNLTVYDPYVNMLRGTTEAMSASLAGIHSLEVLPFNAAFEAPTEFSSRIARNVQLLLKNESHFDSVVDPSGGSYYIEHLTQSIAEQAWTLFQQVEDKGGYIAAFRDGFIPDAVAEAANKKDQNIATRRQILLGTNQYPNFNETAADEVSQSTVSRSACHCGCDDCKCGDNCECGDDCNCGKECDCGCDECACGSAEKKLRPYRGAMAFEQMRLRTDRSGREPKAFMLTCGTLSMARARSQFSSNFFGCAGIRAIDNTFFNSVEEGAKAALASGAEIVVMCAADDDYATLAPKAKELIGDKAILVIAGAPASQADLEAQGITRFISVKSNVLRTQESYLAELGI